MDRAAGRRWLACGCMVIVRSLQDLAGGSAPAPTLGRRGRLRPERSGPHLVPRSRPCPICRTVRIALAGGTAFRLFARLDRVRGSASALPALGEPVGRTALASDQMPRPLYTDVLGVGQAKCRLGAEATSRTDCGGREGGRSREVQSLCVVLSGRCWRRRVGWMNERVGAVERVVNVAPRDVLGVARGVLGDLDLERVLERVLESARELAGARYAAIGVLDESRTALARFITTGVDESTRRQIGSPPTGRGVLGELIRDPTPLRVASVGDHARSYGFPVGHPPMGSFLGVPVMVAGEPFGNLYLTEKHGGGRIHSG